jgi:hypothetical protein
MEDLVSKVVDFLSAHKVYSLEVPISLPDQPHGWGYGWIAGQGDGDGTGSGDTGSDFIQGIKEFDGHEVHYIDGMPTVITSVKGDYAQGYVILHDLTTSNCWIARSGDCYAHGETLKEAVNDAIHKRIHQYPLSERIQKFKEEYPSLDSKIKGAAFYSWHHELTNSCKFGRDQFKNDNDLDPDAEYEVRYLIDLCINSYRSDIIKRLRKIYDESPDLSE